jgi:hypothetical protein
MELAVFYPSGDQNLEVVYRFLENFWTPACIITQGSMDWGVDFERLFPS